LDDALRYTEAAGFDPVAHFSSFLEGEVRQDWADIEDMWRKDVLQLALVDFQLAVSAKLLLTVVCAYRASSRAHRHP
jgi:hypothetical protein